MIVAQFTSSPACAAGVYRFTVDEYHRLIEVGILPEDGRYELLDGVVWRKDADSEDEAKMGHKPSHALVVTLLSVLIARINTPRRHLRIQLSIVLGEHDAPEPDASIVRGGPRDYGARLPMASDVYCVIEVADATLERDLNEKLAAYAAGGIEQYLVINLRNSTIEQYGDPDPQGAVYRTAVTLAAGQMLRIAGGADGVVEVAVAELLP